MNDANIRILLASRLRDLRVASGMTAREVGDKIGKSEKTVSGWEHGRGQPDADTLFSLCQIYGVSSFDVFYSADPTDNTLTQDESDLLAAYRRLNTDGRKAVRDFLRVLSGNPAMSK